MRKEYSGSILKPMIEAYEYISLSNNLNSTFDSFKRVEHPDFAVREALINASVHRDYDYSGSIIVNIFDDRIEFVSLGGLVKGITVEDIKNGISQSRNTVIANIFYRLKLIESYGTGIKRVLEAYQSQAIQPTFRPAAAFFAIMLPKMRNEIKSDMSDRDKALEIFKAKKTLTRIELESHLSCSKSSAVKILVLIHRSVYKKSRTEKGNLREFELRFLRKFNLAIPKSLYACTNNSKTYSRVFGLRV